MDTAEGEVEEVDPEIEEKKRQYIEKWKLWRDEEREEVLEEKRKLIDQIYKAGFDEDSEYLSLMEYSVKHLKSTLRKAKKEAKMTYENFRERGRERTLDWLRKHDEKIQVSFRYLRSLPMEHLHGVRWLVEHGYTIDECIVLKEAFRFCHCQLCHNYVVMLDGDA